MAVRRLAQPPRPAVDGVKIVRRVADPERDEKLLELLLELLDKPATPGDGR